MKALTVSLLIVTALFSSVLLAESTCTYEGTDYPDGTVVCQSGYKTFCNDGTWVALKTTCSPGTQMDGCLCTDREQNNCAASGTNCVSSFRNGICMKKCDNRERRGN